MKIRNLSILLLLSSFLALSYVSNIKDYQKVEADYVIYPDNYIPMSAEVFEDWTDEAGAFEDVFATFWDEKYTFNALDTFFCGERNEGWTGTLTMKPWIQCTQYIYFTWGGARDIDDSVRLEFHYGDYTSTMLNNTFSENPMLLRYFKIPDEQFANLDKDTGFEMYITFVDYRTYDYAFHNFGYLHINQTEDSVGDAMRFYINNMDMYDTREWKIVNNRTIYNHYFYNADLRRIFLKIVDNVDENFKKENEYTESDFSKHWYLDINYDNFVARGKGVEYAITNQHYRDTYLDSTNMPYNNNYNENDNGYYFSGWNYASDDTAIYRFVSRPFVLKGTGIVSVKMAGKGASLHVIDAETQEDLAWADLRSFNGEGNEYPLGLTGLNVVTMVKHYINLSPYVGRTIQLALADVYVDEAHWASAYFDDLVTYYEDYPAFDVDVVLQTRDNDYPAQYRNAVSYYFDQYIGYTHIENDPNGIKYRVANDNVDDSPMYKAFLFLKEFYSKLRSPDTEFRLDLASEEIKEPILNAYNALDEDAKAIVDKSTDLKYTGTPKVDWYYNTSFAFSTKDKVKAAMDQITDEFRTYTVSFDSNGGSGAMESATEIRGEFFLPECTFTPPTNSHEFKCWLVDDEEIKVGYRIRVTSDVTVQAVWYIPQYTVTFASNGGTGDMSPVTQDKGEYILPTCTFEAPENKMFDAWLVNEERKLENQTIDLTGDITITALWKDIPGVTHVVTFNAGEGTGENVLVDNLSGEYALPVCSFTSPTGYEFKAWLIDETEYQPGDTINVQDDLTVIALYKIIVLSVTFDSGDGTGTMEKTSIEYGNSFVLPECTFTAPIGYEFKCWMIGETEYQVNDKVVVTENLTVTASWNLIPPTIYVVSFNSNGGTGEMANIEVEEGNKLTLPACTFVAPEGQEFDYWLVGTEHKNSGDMIDISSDIEIKAVWKDLPIPEPERYVVSFNPNGGTGSMTSVEVEEGTSYTLPACTFVAPEGKEFKCWSVNNQEKNIGDMIEITENVEVKAVWKDVEQTPIDPVQPTSSKGGCGGSVITSSVLLSFSALLGIALLATKKFKK